MQDFLKEDLQKHVDNLRLESEKIQENLMKKYDEIRTLKCERFSLHVTIRELTKKYNEMYDANLL